MRIAVIGSGIAGNSAAWALRHSHEVVLYEKRLRPGGHSATIDINYDGVPISVDTGFIVYNELNYPNFTALLSHLGVQTEASDMSFALSSDNGKQEWSGQNLNTVFAKRRNLLSPRFLLMLREIFKFNKQCALDNAAGRLKGLSLGEYLTRNGFSATFKSDYLLPMGAAIWSTPLTEVEHYPAENFVSFFENHRLIHFDRPQWRTISGGSCNYVSRLQAQLPGQIRLGTMVTRVERRKDAVHVYDANGGHEKFDQVIIAGHTDQALNMLADPSSSESQVLGSIRYRPNEVYLHRDETLMPKRKSVWASWNYMASRTESQREQVTVSYWMNRLQNIDHSKPLFVTLNPPQAPDADKIFGHFVYDHPQFDAAAIQAQSNLETIQGMNRTWFCGAWAGHGFHEDGLTSGLAVARQLGAKLPWDYTEDPSFIMEAAE